MTAPLPGDFAVIRTNGFVAWCIRIACRSRYNHAAFFITPTQVVEAQPGGARVTDWSDYNGYDVILSGKRLPLSDAQRAHAHAVGMAMVGVPYNFLDILCVGLLQYGIKPTWARNRVRSMQSMICSQLVDAARLALGDHLFDDGRMSQDVTPGDLAKMLGYR